MLSMNGIKSKSSKLGRDNGRTIEVKVEAEGAAEGEVEGEDGGILG